MSLGPGMDPGRTWLATGASVAMAGKAVCQDAHKVAFAGKYMLLAVADGAGSARHAEIGSAAACTVAIDHLSVAVAGDASISEGDVSPDLKEVIASARAELIRKAEGLQVPLRDLSTTLLVVAASSEAVYVAQVGDPMLFGQFADGSLLALTMPDRGEYVNTTTMLTSDSAMERVQSFVYSEDFVGLCAMTDGLLNVSTSLPFYRPFAPFLQHVMSAASKAGGSGAFEDAIRSFLTSDRIQSACGDDLTLVLATKGPKLGPDDPPSNIEPGQVEA